MNSDDIKIGGKYRINASGARKGSYEVKGIRQNKLGNTEITVKHEQDPHARTVTPEQIVEAHKPKAESKAQKIISNEIKVISDLGNGVLLMLEDVEYWPNWKQRGRPRKIGNVIV